MRTLYDPQLQAMALRDDANALRALRHVDEHPLSDGETPREAAVSYFRARAGAFALDEGDLRDAITPLSYLHPEAVPPGYRLRADKRQFDSATIVFNQTYLNLPVWSAGLTVTLKQAPWRALAATNTSEQGIDATMPSREAVERFRALFATGEKLDLPARGPAPVQEDVARPAGSAQAKRASARALAPGVDRGFESTLGLIGLDHVPTSAAAAKRGPQRTTGLIRGRFYVYRYRSGERLDPHAQVHDPRGPKQGKEAEQATVHTQPLCGPAPHFPAAIPKPDDSIREGHWYVVAELVFRRPTAAGQRMNWRALVEVETGSILYLRALVSAVDGQVFEQDPITKTGDTTLTPNRDQATLDLHRVSRALNNLNAPVAMTQSLAGTRTFVTNMSAPGTPAPTRPTGASFDFGSRTDNFAAVNAYFHTERFFAMVENLGFALGTYFGGTTFPIETDHRGLGSASNPQGNLINAQCIGDGDGIDYHHYALADTTDTANPIGIACDWRVVLHELGGHGILYDHVGFPNFGFAHSAGDSFAVIMNDPASAWHSGAAIERFLLAPFVPAIPRYSNRGVAEQSVRTITVTGGGSGYTSPPVVTVSGGGGTGATAVVPNWGISGGAVTTVLVGRPGRNFTSAPTLSFSGGGGSGATATAGLGTWGWGGGMDAGGYLSEEVLSTTLFRVYRSLGGDSADLGRRTFAARATAYLILRAVATLSPVSNPGNPGAFLIALQAADAADWTSEGLAGGAYGKVLTWAFEKQNLNGGARPAVDVYIDDGRGGEYPHQSVHWDNVSVWNRRMPDGIATPQEAALGVTNYAYCKVKNRGTSIANDVVVRGYHCLPSAGVVWPNNFQAMTTASISVGTVAANNAEERIVGPFSWTPNANAWGHDCMMMIASATGDPSNVDLLSLGEIYADWRLVPHDNNIGQRNVNFAAAGGGTEGIMASLQGKGFWIGNPNRKAALMAVTIALPPILKRAGWRMRLASFPDGGLRMKPGERRLVTFEVAPGAELAKAEVASAADRDIVVTATADGAAVGGMVYRLDPDLEAPFNDRQPTDRAERCRDQAEALLDCLNVPKVRVKRARVRKVVVDIEVDGGDCCD